MVQGGGCSYTNIPLRELDKCPLPDNPIVELVLRFKDGAALRQVFTTPVPQYKGMPALAKMVAELGAELNIQLPEEPADKLDPGGTSGGDS